MVKQKFSSLGLDVHLNVPETVKEFDENAGKEGACLQQGIRNIVYRGCLADFRDLMIHGRDEVKDGDKVVLTKILGLVDRFDRPRKTRDTGKTRTVKEEGKPDRVEPIVEWDETEDEYVKNLAVEKGWGTPKNPEYAKNLQPIADEIAAAVIFDAKETERKPTAPKKLAENFKAAATRVINNGNWEKCRAKIREESAVDIGELPDISTPETLAKTIETLGWAIKANEDFKEKQSVQNAYA